MATDERLRRRVIGLLQDGHAHVGFDAATDGLPAGLRGARADGVPHTPWRLVEHLRIAQWDVVRYCVDSSHVSPEFPAGYWPEGDAPPDDLAWDRAVAGYRADRAELLRIVADPGVDLLAPFPWGPDHDLLREAILAVDHEAYHLGQLVTVRRMLGAWDDAG